MGKDFTSTIGTNIEKSISRPNGQAAAAPAEQAQRRAQGRTQGRKGCRMMRFNVAFSDENAEYIRLAARATGKTQTQIINDAVAVQREKNADLMKQAEELIKAFKS